MSATWMARAVLGFVLFGLHSLRNWPDRRPPGTETTKGGKSVWCATCRADLVPRLGKCPGCGKRL